MQTASGPLRPSPSRNACRPNQSRPRLQPEAPCRGASELQPSLSSRTASAGRDLSRPLRGGCKPSGSRPSRRWADGGSRSASKVGERSASAGRWNGATGGTVPRADDSQLPQADRPIRPPWSVAIYCVESRSIRDVPTALPAWVSRLKFASLVPQARGVGSVSGHTRITCRCAAAYRPSGPPASRWLPGSR